MNHLPGIAYVITPLSAIGIVTASPATSSTTTKTNATQETSTEERTAKLRSKHVVHVVEDVEISGIGKILVGMGVDSTKAAREQTDVMQAGDSKIIGVLVQRMHVAFVVEDMICPLCLNLH